MKKLLIIFMFLFSKVAFGALGDIEVIGDLSLISDEQMMIWYNGTNYVTFAASSSLSGNYNFTWPVNDGGVSDRLISNGSGALSWDTLTYSDMDFTGLTEGGIILGTGSSIKSLAVATNGQIPIGDGATDPVLATITGARGIDTTNGAGSISLNFDSTEIDATTWSDNANASNIWTFDVSGTDHTMTAGSALMTFSDDITMLGHTLILGNNTHNDTQIYFDGDDYNAGITFDISEPRLIINYGMKLYSGGTIEALNLICTNLDLPGGGDATFTYGGKTTEIQGDYVGIGTTAPDRHLEVNTGDAKDGIRISYNDSDGSATNYAEFLVDDEGDLIIGATRSVIINDANTIGIAANQERIVFDSAGDIDFMNTNVGIETTAPDKQLEINTEAATDGIRISYNDADGTAATYADILLDSNGDLSISATGTVSIEGTGIGGFLKADGSVTLAGAWDMGNQNLTNVDIDSGTIDGITALGLANSVDIGNFTLTAGNLISDDDITAVGTGTFGDLIVDTDTLVVDAVNDRVGIGTTTPNAPLEVKGAKPGLVGGHQSGMFQVTCSDTDEFSNSVITGHNAFNGNTQLWYLGNTNGLNDDIAFINRKNAPLHFYTNNAFRMAIDAAGNVGINETAPQDKLEVNGTVLVKDKLKFTQDDGLEYIDSLNDGYMDYGATTAHRFNNDIISTGDITAGDSFFASAGAAATPGYAFTGYADEGMFLTSGHLAFAEGGSQVLYFTGGNAFFAGAIQGTTLTITDPTQDYKFLGRAAALAIQSQTAATNFTWDLVTNDADGVDSIFLSLFGDTQGAYPTITDRERLIIAWSKTSANNQYEIYTEANGSGTLRPLVIFTEGNTDQLKLGTGGEVYMATAVDDDVVGGTPLDTYWDSVTGQIGFTSSSIKDKENVEDLGKSNLIYQLRPREYNRKSTGREEWGLVAEEVVEDVGNAIPLLVAYGRDPIYEERPGDEPGEPNEVFIASYITNDTPIAINYSFLVPALLAEVQKLRAEVTVLESRLIKLEN